MKYIISIALIIIMALGIIFGIHSCVSGKKGNTRVTNDEAEADRKGRYLTIINDTGQIINEVYIAVGEGSEIECAYQKNPDEKSFSIEIPNTYKEYNSFTVTCIDRYDMKYQKKVTKVKNKGRTEVKITKRNYVKQKNDFKRKIDKFFNGD